MTSMVPKLAARPDNSEQADVITIPASAVTDISSGRTCTGEWVRQSASPWFSFGIGVLMALTKSKKHYLGLTWATGSTKGGLAMQCDKNDYRGVLAGLEGITGKKAVDTDAMNVKN
jgi:hypothetical protein